MESSKLKAALQHWWQGRYVPPRKDYQFVFLLGDYERHWTSQIAHVLTDFYLAHWKWIIGTALAVLGLVTAWFR